jgi:cyclohexanecarboxylate-CoA ligase
MDFDAILLPPRRAAMIAQGLWRDRTINDDLDACVASCPDKLALTGRSKDVIIRGGENVPVVEIETLLYKHPAISQVAIVAYPDERLGERGCAVVVPKQGQAIDLTAVTDFLKAQKVALQYVPEKLVVLNEMPATPSGKIQKFKLRDIVKQTAG